MLRGYFGELAKVNMLEKKKSTTPIRRKVD